MALKEKKILEIISKFQIDMGKSGIYVAEPVSDKHWESGKDRRYDVLTGLYRYLPSEVHLWSHVVNIFNKLPNNEGYINQGGATCLVDFRREGSRNLLYIPGEIKNGARSFVGLTDGVRLLSNLEYWAYSNGCLVDFRNSEETTKGVHKRFCFNEGEKDVKRSPK